MNKRSTPSVSIHPRFVQCYCHAQEEEEEGVHRLCPSIHASCNVIVMHKKKKKKKKKEYTVCVHPSTLRAMLLSCTIRRRRGGRAAIAALCWNPPTSPSTSMVVVMLMQLRGVTGGRPSGRRRLMASKLSLPLLGCVGPRSPHHFPHHLHIFVPARLNVVVKLQNPVACVQHK
ncbi:hypothetical protein GW17_00056919 [Ensete ventricosum]|uniref:Uncharacterized protein n=1 Tax=Ensete ventricosum TaxID=4639 RepID=A0A444C6Z4_ENSVE|nr:hypothetical protein GW17_00056919 [Ensete ventricosum]RZR74223.1 hypothetical protein BHM03_00034053 [Ensete ventricosum]